MRRVALLALFTLVGTSTLGLTAGPAIACSCEAVSDDDALEFADAVFFGQVLEIREDADTFVWLVEVDVVVTGDPASLTTIETHRDGATCGASMPIGEPAVFFVRENTEYPSGEYVTGLCEPTRPVTDAVSVLAGYPRNEPRAADPTPIGFDLDPVDDAPEPIDEVSAADPDEPEATDDDSPIISERDQAELEAAGQPPADAELVDGSDDDENGVLRYVVIAAIAFAAGGLLVSLRRRAHG